MKGYSVLDFGITADGGELITDKLQKMIDTVADCGGGEIIFPKGTYILSTVFLRSNISIILDNAALLGSLDFSDYRPDEKVDYQLYQDASHSFFHCSMLVAEDCDNISVKGTGSIDMRSVWDEKNVRNMVHRGAKAIAFKNCRNVFIEGFSVLNATDLGVYLAGCADVEISKLYVKVYIDGISPDNCRNVKIHDCYVESGDDGIVFKTSYTLNRFEICQDIEVWNCTVKSRCNALKFGTETICGYKNIFIHDCDIIDTRISGIAIESVDGAVVEGITIKDITMKNVNAPFFIHIGKRMRSPLNRGVGSISNVILENISADGPYEPYDCMSWNYNSYLAGDRKQVPQIFGIAESFDGTQYTEQWQMTSNICGLADSPLKNISLKNISLTLYGGVSEYSDEVSEEAQDYPEVYVYGRTLPASGIFFRHIDGLNIDNLTVSTINGDKRPSVALRSVDNVYINS